MHVVTITAKRQATLPAALCRSWASLRGEGLGGAPARRKADGVGSEGSGARLVLGGLPSGYAKGKSHRLSDIRRSIAKGWRVAIGLDTSVVLRLLIGEPRAQRTSPVAGSSVR